MSDLSNPRYGEPNWPLISRWTALAPEQDAPFLAFNLMRYRALADYADGRPTTLTGREADDLYAPLGPLAAVGAQPLFVADIAYQPAGEPRFDRVAIVRYPSRASFLQMQQREDFRELHPHKEAGMEFTILLAAPSPERPLATGGEGALTLRLRRHGGSPPDGDGEGDGVQTLLALELEDVVIGDQRRWDDVRIERVNGGALAALAAEPVAEQIIMVLESALFQAHEPA